MKLSTQSHLTFGLWLPTALAITIMGGLSYWAVQQNYRMSANDPQIQIAEDSLSDLQQVPDLNQLSSAFSKIDINKTLATFLVVYDDNGRPVAGNGYLNNSLPNLPSGTFDIAKKKTDDRFSWQPNSSLRFAAVLKHFSGKQSGFILAARSLRETEKREDMLTIGTAIAWVLSMIMSLLWCGALARWMNSNFSAHDHTHENHSA